MSPVKLLKLTSMSSVSKTDHTSIWPLVWFCLSQIVGFSTVMLKKMLFTFLFSSCVTKYILVPTGLIWLQNNYKIVISRKNIYCIFCTYLFSYTYFSLNCLFTTYPNTWLEYTFFFLFILFVIGALYIQKYLYMLIFSHTCVHNNPVFEWVHREQVKILGSILGQLSWFWCILP